MRPIDRSDAIRIPGPPATIADALDRAGESDRGVAFYSARGVVERELSYRDLREEAVAMARRLTALGFGKGERLGLIAETSPSFLIVFYACQYAGIVACPLPLTTYIGGKEAYILRLAALAREARLAAIIAPAALRDCADTAAASALTRAFTYDALWDTEPTGIPGRPEAGDLAYLQYSSGSTADPKGICITQGAACGNAQSIVTHGLRLGPADRAFSWLPFYHDMGLVGFSIAPLFGPCSVDYLSPSAFARRPRLWLELMSARGTTITYSPTFGYRLAAQRYESGTQAIDLSRLRVAGIGGDMIRADVLDSFADTVAATGFRRSAFLPSYGMAEAVLAISFTDLDETAAVDRSSDMTGNYVSCGRPLPELDLMIADAAGSAVAERIVGHIWVRGPSVIGAYDANPEATRMIERRDGFIDTGDLGYLADGNLVVTGRSKDLIALHGRNIWPQDVEWAAERVSPLKPGDVAAFGLAGEGEDRLVVLVQCGLTDEEERAALRQRIVSAIGEAVGAPAKIVFVAPRSLPFTSSGKLARARAKSLYLETESALEATNTRNDQTIG